MPILNMTKTAAPFRKFIGLEDMELKKPSIARMMSTPTKIDDVRFFKKATSLRAS
jgi:hypothetical protein